MTHLSHHRRDGDDDDKKGSTPPSPGPAAGDYDLGDEIGTQIGEHHRPENEK